MSDFEKIKLAWHNENVRGIAEWPKRAQSDDMD